MTNSVMRRLAAVFCGAVIAVPVACAMPVSPEAVPAAAAVAPTGCPQNETCLLSVRVSDPSDPTCDYGCPSGDRIAVTATGTRSNIPGNYIPPTDFIVVYEVPTSGANCVGVVGTDNGCIEVQSCPVARAVCGITLSWNWNAAYPGATTTHVFEAWTINTNGNYPDYCSGKSWFQYSTSYIYPYEGANQLATAANPFAGSPGANIAETAAAVPDGTAVSVRTYAEDPPFYDSNFSTYECTDDAYAPPGVPECATQPGSYTYPNDQPFGTPSTSGYGGCNAATIPAEPGWSWPSPLTDNGPYQFSTPTTRYYISSQAVFITDPNSNNVACFGLSAAQPQIGVSNWLALSWYCVPTVASLSAYTGSGQSTVDGTQFGLPLSALVVNSCTGQGLPGAAVAFSLPPGAANFVGGSTTETDVSGSNGVATTSALTAGNTPQTFEAQASSGGQTAEFSLTDTCNPNWGEGIAAVSGTPQSTPAGTLFALPLVARVLNQCGTPLSGGQVTFSAPAQYASFDAGSGTTQTDTSSTGSDGTATSSPVHAGAGDSSIGSYDAQATATFGGPFSPQGPVDFSLTNTCNPAVPASMAITNGNGQTVPVSQPFAPLSVNVVNQCGTAWTGGTVTFSGPSPPAAAVTFGTLQGPTTGTGVTDANGVASSPMPFAGALAGPVPVVASVASPSVAPVTFDLSIVPQPTSGGPLILPTAYRAPPGPAAESVRLSPGPGPATRRAAATPSAGEPTAGHVRPASPTVPTRRRDALPRSPSGQAVSRGGAPATPRRRDRSRPDHRRWQSMPTSAPGTG